MLPSARQRGSRRRSGRAVRPRFALLPPNPARMLVSTIPGPPECEGFENGASVHVPPTKLPARGPGVRKAGLEAAPRASARVLARRTSSSAAKGGGGVGQGQRPTGSHPAVLQVPRVGPATEHLGHRLLYTAAALIRAVALGLLSPGQDRPRQAATGLDKPRRRTSAGSRRPARPGVKGLGPLPALGPRWALARTSGHGPLPPHQGG